jgi:hypothetical protein
MPSCSNSSNIQSSFNALSVVQGGSRLLADVTRVSGLTIGNVIRYDVSSTGFTGSKANDPPSSEVFGVIESFDATKFSVVLYGSINLGASNLADMGSGGGSGGNDIYFLSGTTAGTLQNLAPTSLNHIIKPVYQAAPHGSFSGVVMNYLGYKIGGEVESVLEDSELGNIQIVVGDNQFTQGYVDASVSQQLPIADFGEFYAKFGTQYGYIEEITVTGAIGGGVQVGMIGTQPNSTYTGTITAIESGNGVLYLYRAPGASLASVNKKLVIATSATTSVTFDAPLISAEVYSVYSPTITLSQPLVITGNSGTDIVTQKQSVGFKVKPQGVTVNIPRTVTVTSLTASNIALGITWADVGTTLTNFESRIRVLEGKFGI